MSELLDISAAIGKSSKPPFWKQGILRGIRLNVDDPSQYPLVGKASVKPGTLLTFWIAGGDMDLYYAYYWILQVQPDQPVQTLERHDEFSLRGQFAILAHAHHAVNDANQRAERLRDWWEKWATDHGGQIPEVAAWLGAQVKYSQEDQPADFPQQLIAETPADVARFDPINGYDFDR